MRFRIVSEADQNRNHRTRLSPGFRVDHRRPPNVCLAEERRAAVRRLKAAKCPTLKSQDAFDFTAAATANRAMKLTTD